MNDSKFWSTVKMIAIGLLIVFLIMVMSPGWSDEHNSDSDSDDDDVMNPDSFVTDVDVMTDVVIGGDDVLAVSVGSLGAAAMNNCLATTQLAVFVLFKKQGVKLDNWCVAKDMDRAGKYEDAAALRCTYSHYRKLYGDGCTDTMNFGKQKTELEPRLDDERYVQQQQEIEYLREDNASIVGRLEALTKQLEQRPATVPVQVQTQIQKQESDAEQRRSRAKEAYLKALKGSE